MAEWCSDMQTVGLGWGSSASSAAPAIWCESVGDWRTYAEVAEQAGCVARALASERKRLVFIAVRNDYPSVIGYLGALQAGHAVALLNPDAETGVWETLVARYVPDVILSTSPMPTLAGYGDCASGTERLCALQAIRPSSELIFPELTVLLSTSGSTGTPKFVRLAKRNVTHNAAAIGAALRIGAGERPIAHLPLHYSYGMSVLNSHLNAGASIVLTRAGLTEQRFWHVAREHGITSIACVPYHLDILRRLRFETLGVTSLQTITAAGGKAQIDAQQHFHKVMTDRSGRFYVMYGQTEASPRITTLQPDLLMAKLGSVGVALMDGRLDVQGEFGEVVYTGPNVMLGYATERRDLCAGDVLGGSLATGDLGRLDDEGFLYLTGRAKRIAKIYGVRVDLDAIESMIASAAAVAAVDGGDRLLVFTTEGDSSRRDSIRADLIRRTALPLNTVEVIHVEQLPRLASGKTDYAALSA